MTLGSKPCCRLLMWLPIILIVIGVLALVCVGAWGETEDEIYARYLEREKKQGIPYRVEQLEKQMVGMDKKLNEMQKYINPNNGSCKYDKEIK